MAYNNLSDIDFFEKSTEEKTNIKTMCSQCEHFEVISTIHEVPVEETGTITITNVEYLNSTCNATNNILVFNQLKKFHKCPIGKW
jgi:hypothetical protein